MKKYYAVTWYRLLSKYCILYCVSHHHNFVTYKQGLIRASARVELNKVLNVKICAVTAFNYSSCNPWHVASIKYCNTYGTNCQHSIACDWWSQVEPKRMYLMAGPSNQFSLIFWIIPITVTSWWARWHLKKPGPRLHTKLPFVQAQIKENTKAPRHLSLWGEFTGDLWIPHTKGH